MPASAVEELASMAEVLRHRAETFPDRRAFLQLQSDGTPGPEFTYDQLDARAAAVAAALSRCAGEGDRAILLFAPGLEFIPAMFGCLYAGIVAVPAWPPRPDRPWRSTADLARLADVCQPRAILTGGEDAAHFLRLCRDNPQLAECAWIDTSSLPNGPRGWSRAAEDRASISHLQYTSGATGDPKGVVVTHANVMHNERRIAESSGHFATAAAGICGVNWLPFQHDLALIGFLFQPIYVGADVVLLSPLTMLQRPYLWLEAISRYRAHTSAGPNFAYDLCVRRTSPERRAALDLSCWKLAFIGAEPVRPETLDAFSDSFAPAGFEPQYFRPAYGLAEATLLVTVGHKQTEPIVESFPVAAVDGLPEPACTRPHIGCGPPNAEDILRIVDPVSLRPVAAGEIGEIWLSGPSVAQGYWNRPVESRAVFGAQLADSPGRTFLRTGDLGRLHPLNRGHRGELFVVGRLKEVIIVRGQNHHPADIEETVGSIDPLLSPGSTVAFQVDGREGGRLVILQEVPGRHRDFDPIAFAGRVRAAVTERHGIEAEEVVCVKPSTLPKTATGKRQRFACRQHYENQRLVQWRPKRAGSSAG